MGSRGGTWSAGDRLLAAALAGGATQRAAGDRVGVSERTVRRRLEDPEFSELVQRLSSEAVLDAFDRLRGAIGQAFDTVVELTGDGHLPSIRLRACEAIIREFPRYFEVVETEHRLRVLEAAFDPEFTTAESTQSDRKVLGSLDKSELVGKMFSSAAEDENGALHDEA
jgi:hypothetical protein